MIVGNKQMGPVLTSPDSFSVTHDKAVFGAKHVIKQVAPDPGMKLVIEVQIPDKFNGSKFTALSWTLHNLFYLINNELNVGFFKLPLYGQPTDPEIPVHKIQARLQPASEYLCVRIALPGDAISISNMSKHPNEYKIPRYHHGDGSRPKQPVYGAAPLNIQNQARRPQDNYDMEPVKDPNYSANGLLVYLHYIKDIPVEKPTKLKITCSLLLGDEELTTDSNEQMNWTSKFINTRDIIKQDDEGHKKMQAIHAQTEIHSGSTVLPVIDS